MHLAPPPEGDATEDVVTGPCLKINSSSTPKEQILKDFLFRLNTYPGSRDTQIAEFDIYYFETKPNFAKEFVMRLFLGDSHR